MTTTPTNTPSRDELWHRNQLARAILTHRPISHTTTTLALCALDGITIDVLLRCPHDLCPNSTTPSDTRAVIDAP